MKIASVFLLSFILPALASAAPDSYNAYCLVLLKDMKSGQAPPQGEITLKQGESKEFTVEKGISYIVSYGDDLGRQGVVTLELTDKKENKYKCLASVAIGSGTTFPDQIDLVVHNFGGMSCFKPTIERK